MKRKPRRRFEILLPLKYNDGTPIEVEKYLETEKELTQEFGAYTSDSGVFFGKWYEEGKYFEDITIKVYLDLPDTKANRKFFKKYKEILKERFKQLDIWVVSYRINII